MRLAPTLVTLALATSASAEKPSRFVRLTKQLERTNQSLGRVRQRSDALRASGLEPGKVLQLQLALHEAQSKLQAALIAEDGQRAQARAPERVQEKLRLGQRAMERSLEDQALHGTFARPESSRRPPQTAEDLALLVPRLERDGHVELARALLKAASSPRSARLSLRRLGLSQSEMDAIVPGDALGRSVTDYLGRAASGLTFLVEHVDAKALERSSAAPAELQPIANPKWFTRSLAGLRSSELTDECRRLATEIDAHPLSPYVVGKGPVGSGRLWQIEHDGSRGDDLWRVAAALREVRGWLNAIEAKP